MKPEKIAMIADDLSGACDSGVEFLAAGPVSVIVDSGAHIEKLDLPGLVVWNTESRDIDLDQAYDRVRRAARRASETNARVILKQTDSAVRGHFGLEIGAAMDELGFDLCCVAPAIPEAGRVTLKGIQYIGGKPIAETFYRQDPRHPVGDSCVLAASESGSGRKAGLIDVGKVRNNRLAALFDCMKASGAQIAVADGETEKDLMTVASAVISRPGRQMLVGGQGIARALAAQLPAADSQFPIRKCRKILIVCGTLHPASRGQLEYTGARRGIEITKLRLESPGDGKVFEEEAQKAAQTVAAQLKNSSLALLTTEETDATPPESIAAQLALAVRELREIEPPDGYVLTGGETAYEVCRALEIETLRLHSRIAPMVPLAVAPGDTPVVIRGGSIGGEEMMETILGAMHAD